MSERKFHPNIAVFDGNTWFGVPAFFTDRLMHPQISKGIPASFWKFTFVLWRELLKPKKQGDEFVYPYVFNTTYEWFENEHGIGDANVQEWTSAYAVSGLFKIKKGKRHNHKVPGEPSVWYYNTKATQTDWMAFVMALSQTIRPTDGSVMRRRGKSKCGEIDSSGVFKLRLALAVDEYRRTVDRLNPLPPVNIENIERYIRQGHGVREKDGSITYSFLRPRRDGLVEPVYHGEPE